MADPLIFDNPDLGLLESIAGDAKAIDDQRTDTRGYPFSSQNNLPVDDQVHRHNHLVRMLEEDMEAIETASLLDLPVFVLLPDR